MRQWAWRIFLLAAFIGLLATRVWASVTNLAEGAASGTDAVVQYGALGLCGLMVVHQFTQMTRMGKKLDQKDRVIEQVIVDHTAAMTSLSQALGDRPCICKDSRVTHLADTISIPQPGKERG